MAYVALPRTRIIIDVVDKQFDQSVFKQKAVWTGLTASVDDNTDELSIMINTRVDLYSMKDGVAGSRVLNDPQFRSKEVLLHANNNCLVFFNPADLVNPRNGEVLYLKSGMSFNIAGESKWSKILPDGTLENPVELSAIEDFVALQGDLFGVMMENPMVLNQLIIQNMIAANSPLFNKYK